MIKNMSYYKMGVISSQNINQDSRNIPRKNKKIYEKKLTYLYFSACIIVSLFSHISVHSVFKQCIEEIFRMIFGRV